MKQYYFLLAAILPMLGCAAQKPARVFSSSEKSITAADLSKHLHIVAGEAMEGRETGTAGERKAAEYIASQLQALGIEPGNNGSYLQPFKLYRDSILSATLSANGKKAVWNKEFRMTTAAHNAKLDFSEFVYLNLTDTSFLKDRVPVMGKLVVADLLESANGRRNFSANSMLFALQAKGAAALLIISDSLAAIDGGDVGGVRLNNFPSSTFINYAYISKAFAQTLAGSNANALKSGSVTGAEISLNYNEMYAEVPSNNVIGILKGSKKPGEYVVLSAHYDHIGVHDGKINYGADDDGSGTVGVLEIAEAFSKAKAAGTGPERSIVFLWVSGEEKGLLGSEYYSEHPILPLEKTSMDLNIDMIGRTDNIYDKKAKDSANYVYVIGRDKLSSELPGLMDIANKSQKLILDPKFDDPKDPMRIYYRSDHYNFARKGVPVLFFFSGLHADYHKPTDTVDKIDFPLMEKRTRLIYAAAWDVANRPEMMKRDKALPTGRR